MARLGDRLGEDQQIGTAGGRAGRRVPRHSRFSAHRNIIGGRPRNGDEAGDGPIPPDSGAQRKSVSELAERAAALPERETAGARGWRRPSYWPFIVPALGVVVGVIVFPWAFTIW